MFFRGLRLFLTSKMQFPFPKESTENQYPHIYLHVIALISSYILFSVVRFCFMGSKDDKSTVSFSLSRRHLEAFPQTKPSNLNPSVYPSKQTLRIRGNIPQLCLNDTFSNQRIFKSLLPTHLSIHHPICSFFSPPFHSFLSEVQAEGTKVA